MILIGYVSSALACGNRSYMMLIALAESHLAIFIIALLALMAASSVFPFFYEVRLYCSMKVCIVALYDGFVVILKLMNAFL